MDIVAISQKSIIPELQKYINLSLKKNVLQQGSEVLHIFITHLKLYYFKAQKILHESTSHLKIHHTGAPKVPNETASHITKIYYMMAPKILHQFAGNTKKYIFRGLLKYMNLLGT
jgi:hypothetical protein